MSEFRPETEMRKSHFRTRNRLIAAVSPITLVVQARRQSGSLITAKLAAGLGRTLAVVPGFPSDPEWMGCLDLLFDGAQPVRGASDLLSLVQLEGTIG